MKDLSPLLPKIELKDTDWLFQTKLKTCIEDWHRGLQDHVKEICFEKRINGI